MKIKEDFRTLIEILNTFSNITKTALHIKAYYNENSDTEVSNKLPS